MSVRAATYQDLPQLLEIYNDVILNTTSVYSYQPHTLAMREQWFKERMENNYPIFVYDLDGSIAGFSSYGAFRVWPAYKYTVESSVYVHRDHRGKGISKHLLQPLIDDAISKEYHAMIAAIDSSNSVSISLHQQFGFTEVAHFKQVGYKFGRWLDLKFFERLFETPYHPTESQKAYKLI
jgi:phosphinothricin acetyltransferase